MKKKITALFMVCMIIALPIYSASVFAGINNIGIFGKDDIEGYRKENDLTYVEANVSISGDEDITSEQVFFNDIKFSDCRASEDYFTCILGINKNTLEPKTHSFTIKLKDDSESIVDTYVSTFVVDGKAPTIESFSISPKITKKGDITVKYSVKDYAYGTTLGSGLSKIIICKNNIANVVKKITIDDFSCIDSRELQFKTSDFISGTGSANVCIAAYDKLNQLSEIRCEKLSVDETAPKINKDSFKITDYSGNEIKYLSGKQMKVIISIEVEDDSLNKVIADLSGLNKNEPSYKNKIANCVSKNGISVCIWSGITIKMDSPGKVDIKVNAVDTVGNNAEETVSVSVDETAPKINKDSFKLTYMNGNQIDYLSTKPITALISIEVEDDSLNKVIADLSGLNKDEPSYKNKLANCVSKNGISVCTWSGITIKLDSPGKVDIKINATDYMQNSAEESVSHDFKVDIISPIVKSIKSSEEVEYEGITYVKKGSDIIAEIQEEDSGLNLKNFWIKSNWKENIKADNCIENNGVWNCLWTSSALSWNQISSIKVSILSKSEDDAGNSVDLDNSVLSETFVIDSNDPILVGEIEITNLNNRTYVQDEIVSGDKLHIKAVLTDKTPVTASADLSSLGLDEDEKATCTQDGTRWICEWTTSAISPKAVNNILKFKFTDLVGNEAKKNLNVKILGISVEENPNYWEISNIGKMPLAIDRQTTELINHKTYYHIRLKPVDIYDSPIILALDLNCMGDMDYIDDYELINEKSNNPYMILTLKQGTMPNTSLSFNCSLSIVSRVRDVIIQNAEEEPVDVTIDFYNLPLGELGENVKGKIKDAQDGWLVRQEWITTVEHWLDIAETICNLLNTWGKVNEALDDAAILFGDYPFAQTLRKFYEQSHDAHDFIVQHKYNLCKYISCDKTIWGGWYDEFSSKNTPEIFKEVGFGSTFWPSSPKDSIVLSIATGCLPGIIHNLQKMRQIECYYVLCLKKAADEGIPLSVCDEQKAYLECTFIYGEIFQIIPFGGFFKGLAGQFSMIVSDPIGMIFGGLNFYCKMNPTLKTYAVCSLGHLIPTLGSIVGDIQMYFDKDTWSLSGDVCEEAMKPLPEPEDEEDTGETDGEEGDQTTENE